MNPIVLQADCWQATAEAFAALMDQHGLTTDDLQQICDNAVAYGNTLKHTREPVEIPLLIMREIATDLAVALNAQGADPEMLISVARSAYAARMKLQTTDHVMQFIREQGA